MTWHVLTRLLLTWPVLTWPVPTWHVLTWLLLTWPVPTWPVLTWPVLTWHVPTWPVQTGPVPTWCVLTCVYATYCYKLHQKHGSDIFSLKIGIRNKNKLFAPLIYGEHYKFTKESPIFLDVPRNLLLKFGQNLSTVCVRKQHTLAPTFKSYILILRVWKKVRCLKTIHC